MVSTDHCPFCFKEQKELGRGDFSKIPNGIPGVEHRMDLIYQGVAPGRSLWPRWVEVVRHHAGPDVRALPAQGRHRAGLGRGHRRLRPPAHQTLSARTHHMNVDYSAYEGMAITGQAQTVLSRGPVVIDGGEYLGAQGHGRFLRAA